MLPMIIKYCKFDSHISVSEDIRAICGSKPDYIDPKKSIKENVEIMKREENHRIPEYIGLFNDLLQIVNKNNIINVDYNSNSIDNILKLRDFIDYLESIDSTIFPRVFRDNLSNLINLDEIYNTSNNITPTLNKLKNYLAKSNELMLNSISNTFSQSLSGKEYKSIMESLENITVPFIGDKEDDYNSIIATQRFIKNLIINFIKIYPNLIINKLDFSRITKFKHWKLSVVHWDDLIEIVNKHYISFAEFYDDSSIKFVLEKILINLSDIETMSSLIDLMIASKEKNAIFDKDLILLLNKFFIYTIINEYINISQDDSAFLKEPEIVSEIDHLK